MEVVDFLNDLWNVFDDVILKYNVYKVGLLTLNKHSYFFNAASETSPAMWIYTYN